MGGGDSRLAPVRGAQGDGTGAVVLVVGVLHERNGTIAVPPGQNTVHCVYSTFSDLTGKWPSSPATAFEFFFLMTFRILCFFL